MRYFLYIAYKGAEYVGWQKQPNGISIQETIERALGILFKREISILGAGRTDAGVNAYELPAHVDLPISSEIEINQLRKSLNGILPHDIYVRSIKPVIDTAHARFDAIRRTYLYFVATERDPFLGRYVLPTYTSLDFEAMNQVARLFIGMHDFTSFTKLHNDAKHNRCLIEEAFWKPTSYPGVWVFTISANRFLRNMVRTLVGTLLEVGRGNLTLEEVSLILEKQDRSLAPATVKAEPLFLKEVLYPDKIFIQQ